MGNNHHEHALRVSSQPITTVTAVTAQSQVPSYTPGNPTKAPGLAPVGFQLGSNPPSTTAVQTPIFSVANENIGTYVQTNTAYPCYTGITLPQQTSFSQFPWQDGSVQALNQGMQGPRLITCQAPVFTQLTNPMYMHGTAPTFQTGNQAAASVQNIPERPTFVCTPLPASQLGKNNFLPYCANETNNQTPATYFTPGSFQSQSQTTSQLCGIGNAPSTQVPFSGSYINQQLQPRITNQMSVGPQFSMSSQIPTANSHVPMQTLNQTPFALPQQAYFPAANSNINQ